MDLTEILEKHLKNKSVLQTEIKKRKDLLIEKNKIFKMNEYYYSLFLKNQPSDLCQNSDDIDYVKIREDYYILKTINFAIGISDFLIENSDKEIFDIKLQCVYNLNEKKYLLDCFGNSSDNIRKRLNELCSGFEEVNFNCVDNASFLTKRVNLNNHCPISEVDIFDWLLSSDLNKKLNYYYLNSNLDVDKNKNKKTNKI